MPVRICICHTFFDPIQIVSRNLSEDKLVPRTIFNDLLAACISDEIGIDNEIQSKRKRCWKVSVHHRIA